MSGDPIYTEMIIEYSRKSSNTYSFLTINIGTSLEKLSS